MYSYILLAAILVTVAFIFGLVFKKGLSYRSIVIALIFMTILTVIFDNLLIGSEIVRYDEQKILGIKSWLAPIEDYSYMIFAVIFCNVLWVRLRK